MKIDELKERFLGQLSDFKIEPVADEEESTDDTVEDSHKYLLAVLRKAGADCGASGGPGGGFKVGNTCAANRSPIKMSDKAKDLMAKAPLTAKGGTAWRRKIWEEAKDNPELREALIGAQLFTQGQFDHFQTGRRAQLDGKTSYKLHPESYDIDLDTEGALLRGPLSEYKVLFEDQDLNEDAGYGPTTRDGIIGSFSRLVENSPEVGEPVFRGQRFPNSDPFYEDGPRNLPNLKTGEWLANVKAGDDFEFDVPVSTSIDPSIATEFATATGPRFGKRDNLANGYILEIQNPRGLRAASLSPWNRQKEVITSGKYKVVSVSGQRPKKRVQNWRTRMNEYDAAGEAIPYDYTFYDFRIEHGKATGERMKIVLEQVDD